MRRIEYTLLFIFTVLIGFAPAKAEEQIWYETRAAEITIGFDPAKKEYLQRAIYVAFVGPAFPRERPNDARKCAEVTVKIIKEKLILALESSADRLGKLPDQSIEQRAEEELRLTTRALHRAATGVDEEVFSCLRKRGVSFQSRDGYYLSLVQRDCNRNTCKDSTTNRRLAESVDSTVFSALYRWVASKTPYERRNETNRHFRLTFTQGNPPEVIVLETDFLEARPGFRDWVPPRPPTEWAALHRSLVSELRNASRTGTTTLQIPATAGLAVEAVQADLLRGADIYASAAEDYRLASAAGEEILAGLSNEIARIRLRECRFYRGATTLNDLSTCSGFEIGPQLDSCLSNVAKCDVQPKDLSAALAILTDRARSIDTLATRNLMPRVTRTLDELRDEYNRCPGSERQIASCFAEAMLQSNAGMAFARNCLAVTDRAAKISCAMSALNTNDSPELQCLERAGQRAIASCLVSSRMPPDVRQAIDCLSPGTESGQLLICASGALGGDAARVSNCVSTRNQGELAFATCLAGNSLSPEVRNAVQCFQQSAGNSTAFVTCAVTSQLPPKLAGQIGCFTQSGGDPVGAGVCIASSSLPLSANQQLALQCLASTGGEPFSFGGCFVGQLTVIELRQCRGKNFGEGNCFGQNNEFQKLARALTGDSIGPNSVVGHALTATIRPFQEVLAFNEKFLGEATAVVSKVAKNAEQIGKSLLKAGENLLKSGARVVDDIRRSDLNPSNWHW